MSIVIICLPVMKFEFFLTAMWLSHGQLWAILEGDSLANPMLITAFSTISIRILVILGIAKSTCWWNGWLWWPHYFLDSLLNRGYLAKHWLKILVKPFLIIIFYIPPKWKDFQTVSWSHLWKDSMLSTWNRFLEYNR